MTPVRETFLPAGCASAYVEIVQKSPVTRISLGRRPSETIEENGFFCRKIPESLVRKFMNSTPFVGCAQQNRI